MKRGVAKKKRERAKSLYYRGATMKEISSKTGYAVGYLHNLKKAEAWDDDRPRPEPKSPKPAPHRPDPIPEPPPKQKPIEQPPRVEPIIETRPELPKTGKSRQLGLAEAHLEVATEMVAIGRMLLKRLLTSSSSNPSEALYDGLAVVRPKKGDLSRAELALKILRAGLTTQKEGGQWLLSAAAIQGDDQAEVIDREEVMARIAERLRSIYPDIADQIKSQEEPKPN